MEGKVELAGDGSYYVHHRGSTVPVSPDQGSNPAGAEAGSDRGGSSRRKRGRPRKYGPDMLLSFPAATAAAPRRGRGRPPGTGRRQQRGMSHGNLISAALMSLTPHVMIIETGEDITGKIISFAEEGPKPICVLSANGTVSTVTLRQPLSSCGMVTYEGRFEIINLSGSLMLTETAPNRMEGLNISLSSTDGRIIGGVVSGMTIAATPVQVVVGVFGYGDKVVKNNTQVNPGSGSGTESEPETADAENPDAGTSTMPGQSKNSSMLMGEWPNSRQMNSKNARA